MFWTLVGATRLRVGSSFWHGCRLVVKGPERPFRGSSSATESLRGQSDDSTVVIRKTAQPKKPRRTEFKGLTSQVSGELRATFSGFVGRPKRCEVYLLIRQGLLEKPLRRPGEGLLNLKDLPAVVPSSGWAICLGFVGRVNVTRCIC
jgi:hypothetical protein